RVLLLEERLVAGQLVADALPALVGGHQLGDVGVLLGELLELVAPGDDVGVGEQPGQLLVARLDFGELVEHGAGALRGVLGGGGARGREDGAARNDGDEGEAGYETLERPYFLVKRSMRPAVSMILCLPV